MDLGVAKIDDAAILKRAKELEEAGIAWDWFSARAPDTRVLNNQDRRGSLMRARDELMQKADEIEPSQGPEGFREGCDEPARTETGEGTEELEAERAKNAAAELEREAGKARASR
jgi:hypothetical protein